MPLPLSAALLAGGKSSRMGRDKALLLVEGHAMLWQRQLAVLEGLNPRRIFWSGPPRDGLPARLLVTPDEVTNAGPLAGIASCLDAATPDLLLVLAIDLPLMNATFLQRLRAQCRDSTGVVPRLGDRFEPLAAIYPTAMLPLARKHLAAGRRALQEFVSAGITAGHLRSIEVHPDDAPLFRNLNRPEDL